MTKSIKKETSIYKSFYPSPLGEILLASNGSSLTGLWFEGQKYYPANTEKLIQNDNLEIFIKTKKWLTQYFNKENPNIKEIPVAQKDSNFRCQVWEILCQIPYGTTMTYGEIAKKIAKIQGKNISARAVGGAVSHNPVSIIIPCHRVMGSNGKLTGYAGGLDKKQKLLELESNKHI